MNNVPGLSENEGLFEKALEYFNSGYYFEAHDAFEELWMDGRDPKKLFFQGLVQLSTGFYHLVMKNLKGAESQLSKGIEKLREYHPSCEGIDIGGLIKQVETCLSAIRNTQEEDPFSGLVQFIPKLERELN